MAKRTLKGRTKVMNAGKTMGRSYGPLVFNEHVGVKVTQKIDKDINSNRSK
jgi:hypothetical protein